MRIGNTIIHSAILLCSTMVPRGQELADYTVEYLQNKNLAFDPSVVSMNMEKYNKGAKLYAAYRDKVELIEKKGFVQELYRYLWVYRLVACMYDTIKPQDLFGILVDKFEEEKAADEFLERDRFGAFKLIDREFCKAEAIKGNGKILAMFSEDLDNALTQLTQSFSALEGFEYMADIYSKEAVFEISGANEQSDTGVSFEIASGGIKSEKTDAFSNEPVTDVVAPASGKTELQLKDEIRLLRKKKHDLEVKLAFAKKDAIRDVLCDLTDYGWNCPLNELYRLSRDEKTPEEIKGVINNLFKALGEKNIKLTRDKIGETITITEENMENYAPYKYDRVSLGDTVEIYYPGYGYREIHEGRAKTEIMVKPVVKKTTEEDSNENG